MTESNLVYNIMRLRVESNSTPQLQIPDIDSNERIEGVKNIHFSFDNRIFDVQDYHEKLLNSSTNISN